MATDLGVISFEDMPDKYKTPEICLEAIKQRGLALKYVPEAMKTEAVCLAAVRENGYALKYVPIRLKAAIYEKLTKRRG
jgi:uncharacterized SAM-dependent methyltransferase